MVANQPVDRPIIQFIAGACAIQTVVDGQLFDIDRTIETGDCQRQDVARMEREFSMRAKNGYYKNHPQVSLLDLWPFPAKIDPKITIIVNLGARNARYEAAQGLSLIYLFSESRKRSSAIFHNIRK